ncbi:MAG: large conductance mechanosensitive channel protein MscL [Candidatus Kapaibacteriales bacterium]
MGMMKDFKEFAVKGNMMELAVGIIIGSAFTAIVKSLVADIINPIIGIFLGDMALSEYMIVLKEGSVAADGTEIAPVAITYGNFLTGVIDFIIIAFVVFLLVKAIANLRKKEEEKPVEPAAPPQDVALLTEIRDLLSKQ